MSLFGKSPEEQSSAKSQQNIYPPDSHKPIPKMQEQKERIKNMDKAMTLIAQGANFKGTLKSDDPVQIDGSFDGEIEVKQTVNIGSSAVVKANINAGEIKISGRVDGNIDAKERLEIMSTGKVFGDIKTPRLIIAEGVVFEGHCTMGTEKKTESAPIQQKPKVSSGNISI